MTKKIKMTELVLRDAHQSLFATRLRLDDMLPIAHELDDIRLLVTGSLGRCDL